MKTKNKKNKGNIHGYDIRRRESAWTLIMEPAMGPITCMAIGPTIHSMVVGTARGFIVLWDLRFEFPVQMWYHYDHAPIVSLTVLNCESFVNGNKLGYTHPQKGPLVLVSTAVSNELCAFDLISGECRSRFQMFASGTSGTLGGGGAGGAGAGSTNPAVGGKHGSTGSLQSVESPNYMRSGFMSGLGSRQQSGGGNSSVKEGETSHYKKSTMSSTFGAHGIKVSQMHSVYPATLGQCSANYPFHIPSLMYSNLLRG